MHQIYVWFLVFFHWPDGSMWSNLLSDPFLALLGLIGLGWVIGEIKAHVDKHHAKLHETLERHHKEKMEQAEAHHQEQLKAIKNGT